MKRYNSIQIALLALLSIHFTVISCTKEDLDPPPPIVIDDDDDTDEFIALDPDLNAGPITFETTGPSFEADDELNSTNPNGTWGRFGETGDSKITVAYADNPSKSGINTSERVIQVTEPADVQSWAGFFFNLKETINFPSGKEAISVQFNSPGPNHNVLLKLEDQLTNDDENKKSSGDLFATTTGSGWETLIFNVPEKNGQRSGIYNRITMILGYGVTNTGQKNYQVDTFNFDIPKEVVAAVDPTDAPEAPTAPANQVLSIFSNAYTDIEGTNFNPNWNQSTVVSIENIANNDVLKYAGLNYQGTQFASPLDVSGKTKLHLDYFTGNATVLKFFLISSGPNEKAYELNVSENPGTWKSVDIDLTYFSEVVDLSDVIQFKVEGTGTVYFDNIYFYGVNSAPTTGQTAPDKDAGDVLSIYSDTYTSSVSANLNPNWSQGTVVEEVDLNGNSVLKYGSLDYQGTDWASTPLDVSGMEYLHFDYWTAEASKFNFYVISPGPKEKAYAAENITLGQWVSVDVPLSYFGDVVDLSEVFQFKVDDAGSGESATVYFDNFYFWKSSSQATSPNSAAEDPTFDAEDVKSVYSEVYDSAVNPNLFPGWGQTTQFEEVEFDGGKKIVKYSNLNYQGIDFSSTPLDVSDMTHINFDYWTADAEGFDFYLISSGAEKKSEITPTTGSWQRVSIPLSEFNDVVNISAIIQFKIDVQAYQTGVTIFFDNIFFSK